MDLGVAKFKDEQNLKNSDAEKKNRHHVSQADIEEHPSCDGEDDVGREAASEQDAEDQADVAGQGRH